MALPFYQEKGQQEQVDNIRQQLSIVYLNHTKFFQEMNLAKESPVERLGDMYNGGKCTVCIKNEKSKYIYKPVNVDLLLVLGKALTLLNDEDKFDFFLPEVSCNHQQYSTVKFI